MLAMCDNALAKTMRARHWPPQCHGRVTGCAGHRLREQPLNSTVTVCRMIPKSVRGFRTRSCAKQRCRARIRFERNGSCSRGHRMDRREVIGWVSFGAVLWTLPVLAQSGRVAKIGFLGNSTAALEGNLVAPFLEGLREQGYVEGRDVVLEYRWAEGDY